MLIFAGEMALLILLLIAMRAGGVAAIVVAMLVACALAPEALLGKSQIIHVGISGATPILYTYTVVVIVAVITLTIKRRFPAPPLASLVVIAYMMTAAALDWGWAPNIIAGVIHLITVFFAYSIGANLASEILETAVAQRTIIYTVTAVLGLQLAVSVLQLQGRSLVIAGHDLNTGLYGSRATGTLVSPGNLAKVVFLLVMITLPFLDSREARVRALSRVSVLMGVLITGLTQSRANAVAIVAMLMLWAVLSSDRRTLAAKIRLMVMAMTVAAPFAFVLLRRFQADPHGGARPELLSAGLRQISLTPIFGIGPNNYVETVGLWDPATAAGFPVHDTLLLAFAELGIPAALLLFSVYVGALRIAWRARAGDGQQARFGAALLAAMPGIVLIGWTGWGLLSTFVAVLWFFTLGLTVGAMVMRTSSQSAPSASGSHENRVLARSR